MKKRSREIIEIIADVVAAVPEGCDIVQFDGREFIKTPCPAVSYRFGNAQYLKDCLDVNSKSYIGTIAKFPLIHLFCPFNEQRNLPDLHSKASVRLVITCSSRKDWSNEERLVYSFQNILRPIYRAFLEKLEEDGRLDFGYDGIVPHSYSENYSYGRYGAFTPSGEEVSEPIDAIVISNLELKVKLPNC